MILTSQGKNGMVESGKGRISSEKLRKMRARCLAFEFFPVEEGVNRMEVGEVS